MLAVSKMTLNHYIQPRGYYGFISFCFPPLRFQETDVCVVLSSKPRVRKTAKYLSTAWSLLITGIFYCSDTPWLGKSKSLRNLQCIHKPSISHKRRPRKLISDQSYANHTPCAKTIHWFRISYWHHVVSAAELMWCSLSNLLLPEVRVVSCTLRGLFII